MHGADALLKVTMMENRISLLALLLVGLLVGCNGLVGNDALSLWDSGGVGGADAGPPPAFDAGGRDATVDSAPPLADAMAESGPKAGDASVQDAWTTPTPPQDAGPNAPVVVDASGGKVTLLFSFTGAESDFIVPPGVSQITVDARGAAGGNPCGGTLAGLGGGVIATIPVTPGETLAVFVGGAAGNNASACASVLPSGWNGGGPGGSATPAGGVSSYPATGGGGGGASDVRRGGNDLTNRVLVAGGGGGGGGGSGSQGGGIGGAGGSASGGSGIAQMGGGGNTSGSGSGGTGGGGTQPGTGGSGGGGGEGGGPGMAGGGGSGGSGTETGGGGGGGGHYGGGGGGAADGSGSGGGGGGGSSYVDGTATNVVFQQGVGSDNGRVYFTYSSSP